MEEKDREAALTLRLSAVKLPSLPPPAAAAAAARWGSGGGSGSWPVSAACFRALRLARSALPSPRAVAAGNSPAATTAAASAEGKSALLLLLLLLLLTMLALLVAVLAVELSSAAKRSGGVELPGVPAAAPSCWCWCWCWWGEAAALAGGETIAGASWVFGVAAAYLGCNGKGDGPRRAQATPPSSPFSSPPSPASALAPSTGAAPAAVAGVALPSPPFPSPSPAALSPSLPVASEASSNMG